MGAQSPRSEKLGKGAMASRCWGADKAFARTPCAGQETTRAIWAVRMSAGDKDRPGFHRLGGSLTQGRSRDSTEEHEHCTANMLTIRPQSSVELPTSSAPASDLGYGRAGSGAPPRRSEIASSLRSSR